MAATSVHLIPAPLRAISRIPKLWKLASRNRADLVRLVQVTEMLPQYRRAIHRRGL